MNSRTMASSVRTNKKDDDQNDNELPKYNEKRWYIMEKLIFLRFY